MDNLINLNGRTLTASEYYYDCTPDTWDNMLYPDAIKDRAKRAKELYFKLYKKREEFKGEQPFEEQVRLFKVEKAYKDTRQIVDERDLII